MVLHNAIADWLIAFGIIVISFIAIRIVKTFVVRKLKAIAAKTNSTFDDFFALLIEKTLFPVLYLGAAYLGVSYLELSDKTTKVLHVALLVAATFFVVRAITILLNYVINRAIDVHNDTVEKRRQARGIIIIVNIVIWALGIVFLINNLGYNITSVITGLGIGGIAIALASQTVLGDLFNYFVIFFDKPFEIGDFIIVDDKMGSVEYIGIKSTRLRTLSGEQLICSNTNLTNARIHNYKRMLERRVVFTLSVGYNTSIEKIKKIPPLLKQIIESKHPTRFDRAHFAAIGSFSFNFEVVYYILSADYNLFMDRQQEIYLDILNAFEKEKIQFAYPTQALMINGQQQMPWQQQPQVNTAPPMPANGRT
jgi:small-conductance mechanosensitive channel